MRVIRCIREMLCLEADAAVRMISGFLLTGQKSKTIPSDIYMNAGLVSVDEQLQLAFRTEKRGSRSRRIVEYEGRVDRFRTVFSGT